MSFFDIIRHLLPRARAWRVTINKQLRQFFQGLGTLGDAVKQFLDLVWLDAFPATTREIGAWEKQFALTSVDLTDQQRRDRLDAAWKATGGQSPSYIQNTLQANGFDVYVHEWWVPGTESPVGTLGPATARNPFTYLSAGSGQVVPLLVDAGEATVEAGEATALAGNSNEPAGYALVNKGFEYNLPVDTTKWPYFLYIGAESFGTAATVDPKRRDEFETLCLKICPAQQWLGLLIQYT